MAVAASQHASEDRDSNRGNSLGASMPIRPSGIRRTSARGCRTSSLVIHCPLAVSPAQIAVAAYGWNPKQLNSNAG
jgi:hypothetical protein